MSAGSAQATPERRPLDDLRVRNSDGTGSVGNGLRPIGQHPGATGHQQQLDGSPAPSDGAARETTERRAASGHMLVRGEDRRRR